MKLLKTTFYPSVTQLIDKNLPLVTKEQDKNPVVSRQETRLLMHGLMSNDRRLYTAVVNIIYKQFKSSELKLVSLFMITFYYELKLTLGNSIIINNEQ